MLPSPLDRPLPPCLVEQGLLGWVILIRDVVTGHLFQLRVPAVLGTAIAVKLCIAQMRPFALVTLPEMPH